MINYSLGMRLSNPADKNSEKKVYAYAQVRETLTLNQLAKHISSHGSPYIEFDLFVPSLSTALNP